MCIRESLALSLVLVVSLVGISYGIGGILPGDGLSESTAYLIEDLADFDVFADQANAATYWACGVYTKLTCNINLTGRSYLTAVIAPDVTDTTDDFDGISFEGVFDGNGHIVENMTIDTAGAANDYLGLFGKISEAVAQVKNLGVEAVNITGGGLSHDIGGLYGYNWKGAITNCYADGTITGGDESHDIGGLCGKIYGGEITNCYATAIVHGGRESYDIGGLCGKSNNCVITNSHTDGTITCEARSYDVGGLCGKIYGGEITNCYATGAITSGNQSYVLGSLCGNNNGGAISDCYATGTVYSGRESYDIGGLVGYNNNGSLNDCYATGAVTGEDRSYDIGGLCGNNDDGTISNCYATGSVSGGYDSYILGGLCGNNNSTITKCYAVGAITGGSGSHDLGGLCGFNSVPGTITESFWDVETSGIGSEGDDNYGATGKTTAQMQTRSTFTDANWDFDVEPLWKMPFYESGYPMLAWQWNGNGSQAQPYLIENMTNFDAFADQANAATYWASGVYTKLICDIDLTGKSYTTAVIAPSGSYFEGVFDGEGHAIKNLIIDTAGADNDYLGLFGKISGSGAQVKNLGIENTNIIGGDYSYYLGGLCGHNQYGTIANCYSTGSVNGRSDIGGLCGRGYGGTITNCYATGAVTGGGSSYYLGGLCGHSDYGTITNSYATGSVTNGDYILGGLCGYNYGGAITNCYATGFVTGEDNSEHLGGLCGANNGGTITNCYAVGAVTSGDNSDYLGGLCGCNLIGPITDCFWDTQSSGMSVSDGGTGKTTVEMQTESTFTDANWDFSVVPVWHMPFQATGYPMLGWQRDIPGDFTGRYGVYMDDFAVLADTWSLSSGQADYNDLCDLMDNDTIDLYDLATFAENWLVK